MTVVATPLAVTVTTFTSWQGGAAAESSTLAIANGNAFVNTRGTILVCRNTTAGAILINFYADIMGTEVLLGSPSVAATGSNNGRRIIGPFPSDVFNDHSTSCPTFNGSVVFKQASGAIDDVRYDPVALPLGLAR